MPTLSGKTCVIIDDGSSLGRAVAEQLRAHGAAVVADLAPAEPNDASWSAAFAKLTKADAIIIPAIPAQDGGFGSASLNDFRRILEASYVRVFLGLKYGLPLLRANNGGAFVAMTSVDGTAGAENGAARAAAAQGIVLMAKSAALEYAGKPENIRVNTLLVGDILRGGERKLARGHVSPGDVANSVVYLASDAASYLTGLALPVDNGGALR